MVGVEVDVGPMILLVRVEEGRITWVVVALVMEVEWLQIVMENTACTYKVNRVNSSNE